MSQKLKKTATDAPVGFVKTPDVLFEVSQRVQAHSKRPFLMGFAAETENVVSNAREKLERKNLDVIVANDVSAPGTGFGSDSNAVTLLFPRRPPRELSGSKASVAAFIFALARL